MDPSDSAASPYAALRQPVFRLLWSAMLMANVCTWMSEVAAAWMMTSLTTDPLWVALVQTAAALPVFLLGLPSGALADGLHRKHYLMAAQLWVAAVAALASALVFLGLATPTLLLAMCFASGVGLTMRWPVFAAIVPELVPRPRLPSALALSGLSMNASRIVGPLIAGAILASAGGAWVFLSTAVLSLLSAALIARWHSPYVPKPQGREPLGQAVRTGLQHVLRSPVLKGVLLRILVFFFHSCAMVALLALVARGLDGGHAGSFTALLACMGAGAISATAVLPRLRRRFSRDGLVQRGSAVQACAMAALALTDSFWVAAPAMLVGGAAWITTANTLSVSMQLNLPDWVRARGMAIFQMALMGASAAGAATWGQIAAWTDVPTSLGVAALSAVLAMAWVNHRMPEPAQSGRS